MEWVWFLKGEGVLGSWKTMWNLERILSIDVGGAMWIAVVVVRNWNDAGVAVLGETPWSLYY